MTIASLGGLPQFLRLLTTYPEPDAVMAALVAGPLARYGARAARFSLIDGEDLVHVGGNGYSPDEIDRYRILTPNFPSVVWTTVREARITVTASDALQDSPLDKIDRDFRMTMFQRLAISTIVRVPLEQDGRVIGALSVGLTDPWPGGAEDDALMVGLAGGLALWVATSAGRADHALAESRLRAGSSTFVFSDRQRDILRLVEARVPTAAIAHALQVSESTVKAELQVTMRALAANDRVEAATRARQLGFLD
jgi:DNA-binding CsgD family transcriptional regulator